METVSSRLDLETINLFGKVLKEKRSEVVRELVESGKKHKAVELYKNKKVSLVLGARLAGAATAGQKKGLGGITSRAISGLTKPSGIAAIIVSILVLGAGYGAYYYLYKRK